MNDINNDNHELSSGNFHLIETKIIKCVFRFEKNRKSIKRN